MITYLFLSILLLSPYFAQASVCPICDETISRESRGAFDPRLDSVFDELTKSYPAPKDWDGFIDPYMMLKSQRAIVRRSIPIVLSGKVIKNKKNFIIPIEIFSIYHERLRSVFKENFSLSEQDAVAMADNLLLDSLESAQIDRVQFENAADLDIMREEELNARFLKIAKTLRESSQLDLAFDVPYVAGYAWKDRKYIFIDRAIPEESGSKNRMIPVHLFLTMHERVEKVLLDEFQLVYPHAHQAAQRSERRLAIAHGFAWNEYDAVISKLADKMGKKKPMKISSQLDMTPYYQYTDKDNLNLLKEMEKAKK